MVEDGGTKETDVEAAEEEAARWTSRGEVAGDAGMPAVRRPASPPPRLSELRLLRRRGSSASGGVL